MTFAVVPVKKVLFLKESLTLNLLIKGKEKLDYQVIFFLKMKKIVLFLVKTGVCLGDNGVEK